MLRVKFMKRAGEPDTRYSYVYDERWTEYHRVVIQFADPTLSLILAASKLAEKLELTVDLEKLAENIADTPTGNPNCVVKTDNGDIDFEATFERVYINVVGKEFPEAYAFRLSISEITDGEYDIFHSYVSNVDVSTQSVVGIGSNEEIAKKNAKERLKAQLNYLVSTVKGEFKKINSI